MGDPDDTQGNYWYGNERPNPSHKYLWPVISKAIDNHATKPRRAIDVGCGNGVTANWLADHGFDVVGIEPSRPGILRARQAFDRPKFEFGNGYDDLAARYGQYPLVVCLEVVEHLYAPQSLAKTLFDLTSVNGTCIVSTPYHGYWKNLALAITGRMDKHHNPLRIDGHIKFFSASQLIHLLEDAGFRNISIERVGRIPPLAKSMVAIATRPH